MNAPDALLDAARAVHPIARDGDGPVFREPWEAQAFAMVVALHEAGLFGWSEWTAALSREIAAASWSSDHDPDDSYYRCWLTALERLVVEKGAASRAALASRRAAWARAAQATPHGEPILLANDPERPPDESPRLDP
jgi:nitrile hydratase accessory protein